MAVGDSGRVVNTTALVHPSGFADRVGAHIHKGSAESTVGGPGATEAHGASQQGSSGTGAYGSEGGDDGQRRMSDGDWT